MPIHEQLKEQARANARAILSNSQAFRSMEQAEQMAIYKDTVNSEYDKLYQESVNPQQNYLAQQSALVTALGERGASKQIDEGRHENRRIEQAAEMAGDFIEGVNFPKFVKDLLKGVFDANLEVSHAQMEDFQKLVREATKSVQEYAKQYTDDDAMYHLAERQGNDFSLMADDSGKQTLGDKNRKPLDENELKAKILDAKLAMARERRALLREIILMGVTRLVVEKGTIKAAVVFDIRAKENIDKADRAADNRERTSGKTFGGGLGGLFGGQRSDTNKTTQISISSAKSQSTTDLQANITGSVEIQFKTDYFKLDNFMQMYGPVQAPGQTTPATGQPAKPALAPGQAPPPPTFQ
ncbi:hypothetical protein NIES4071_29480 [Calothrix sp. NIES-4071]|nr:hypothetical protein NIES4071_29480 [Calothrix sp. NIES-4071]BAZ57268.1 hypothetical protein NIES4105_29420 [Calothrix sp. NIES-4105]